MKAANSNRGGLHAILREHGGGRGGRVRNDERQVILLHLADSGKDGGITIAQWQLHAAAAPKSSFSLRRTPLRKASAERRLRPSICTSSGSSAVAWPAATSRRFFCTIKRPGSPGPGTSDTRAFQI